jgi:hypothetical protein
MFRTLKALTRYLPRVHAENAGLLGIFCNTRSRISIHSTEHGIGSSDRLRIRFHASQDALIMRASCSRTSPMAADKFRTLVVQFRSALPARIARFGPCARPGTFAVRNAGKTDTDRRSASVNRSARHERAACLARMASHAARLRLLAGAGRNCVLRRRLLFRVLQVLRIVRIGNARLVSGVL